MLVGKRGTAFCFALLFLFFSLSLSRKLDVCIPRIVSTQLPNENSICPVAVHCAAKELEVQGLYSCQQPLVHISALLGRMSFPLCCSFTSSDNVLWFDVMRWWAQMGTKICGHWWRTLDSASLFRGLQRQTPYHCFLLATYNSLAITHVLSFPISSKRLYLAL